ncbi:MAG: sigma-54 interaction domain-containing protein [Thermogutta sp.]
MSDQGVFSVEGRIPVSAGVVWERTLREILAAACEASEVVSYLQSQSPHLRRVLGAQFFGLLVLSQNARGYEWLTAVGELRYVGEYDWAKLIDRHGPLTEGSWCLQPLSADQIGQIWIAARFDRTQEVGRIGESLADLAETLGTALQFIAERHRTLEQLERQTTLLKITQRWYQARQLRPLLNEIARAAAEFLHADRATIFLWNREAKVLIGRPALGVDDELRIPDDVGIAGRVLHTGQPVRVTSKSPDQANIDRRIDEQLGYHTETLICVPLRTRGGRVLGVFEVLNKKDGAFTVEDEVTLLELAEQAATALESVRDYEQALLTRRQIVEEAAGRVQLVGQSPAILRVRRDVERLAQTDLPVLIIGENGTGKEVVAQMLHYLGDRRESPFVAVNCAAIPESLAESELFGHEKGAFTDAHQTRPGKFELAQNGTVFLDEVAELSLAAQAKLLRVLEERTVVRVGGTEAIPVNARVITATNRDLQQRVAEGKFREDLFYRLNTVMLTLPPLRERGDDIIRLAEHFLAEFSAKARRPIPVLTTDAKEFLLQYPWPGNVRELRNAMERIVYLCPKSAVEPSDLGLNPEGTGIKRVGAFGPGLKLREATRRFQREYILRTIEATQNNVTLAASKLGLHRANLYRKMRQLEIPTRRDEDPESQVENN